MIARLFLLLLVVLMLAPAAFAQNRRDDYSSFEFYVGYAYERANNNADCFDRNGSTTFNGSRVDFRSQRVGYNGFEVEFNQNVSRHFGVVTQFTGTFNRTDYLDVRSGRTFRANVQRYDLLGGVRYNWRPRGVTPFAEALFGISHIRPNFRDTLNPQPNSKTAFAMALGGGLDVNAGEHLDLRVIQVDYFPTFFNGSRQDNIKASAGIKIK